MSTTTDMDPGAINVQEAPDERVQVFDKSESLQELCRDNGITVQQFARRYDSVTVLEMFLGFWESMKGVMYFPALKELYIVNHPTICLLEGVDHCANLEVLCVTECGLTQIPSLVQCPKLKTVNLSSNRISQLDSFNSLNYLETLWINDNAIDSIENVRNLPMLTQLWAARNHITRIENALDGCNNLKELNLSGNRINSFKGLLPLTSLDSLSVLTLNDPHFGDNPVCRLCNYQTYLMCHLSKLAFLDTAEVLPRNKQIAEATMMKKKVYYNMRIRSIRREVRLQIQRYDIIRSLWEQQLDANVSALMRQKKEIECFLSEHQQSLSQGAPRENQATVQLERKVDCLNSCLDRQYSAIHCLNNEFDQVRSDLMDLSDRNTYRLLLELETAGNIRLEDGKMSDAWYSSCVDLVRSRLFNGELKAFGIEDVCVSRVTRVSNRFLRNRFHAKMEEIVTVPGQSAKENVSKKGITIQSSEEEFSSDMFSHIEEERLGTKARQYPGSALDTSVEYLFYLQPRELDHSRHGANAEQYFAAEHGFRDPAEYAEAGLDGAIKLSNSVALLDLPRIRAEMSYKVKKETTHPIGILREGYDDNSNDASALSTRVLMITKVFLGYTKTVAAIELPNTSSSSGISSSNYAGLNSLQVLSLPDSTALSDVPAKEKTYYVFDHELILPEYLVEFKYVMQGENALLSGRKLPSVQSHSEHSSAVPFNFSDSTPQANDIGASEQEVEDDNNGATFASLRAAEFERRYRSRRRLGTDTITADESTLHVLEMGPSLPSSLLNIDTIPDSTIAFKINALRAGGLNVINLIGCNLDEVPNLTAAADFLQELVLSYNNIQSINGVAVLSKLKILDLSCNRISHLAQLEELRSLESLDLSQNLLSSFTSIEYVGRTFAALTLQNLDLRKNPLTSSKRYRLHALQSVPYLKELDHQKISSAEIESAMRLVTKLSTAKVWELCTRNAIGLSTSYKIAEMERPESEEEDSQVKENSTSATAWNTVEEIDVTRELISSIEGLELAVNLRVANFADNMITSTNGLDVCRRLEELCLEDNDLSRIGPLTHLTMLKKLYLGRNKISVIEGLEHMDNLVQLSLEDNLITSLRGLGGLSKLVELYLGNNKIETLKDIQHLKSLPKLTILDLAGNEVTRLTDYRVYTVYHLRRAKVLDGVTITAQDQSAAKQKYSGKLTLELVMEKCGIGGGVSTPRISSGSFDRIVEMDLSSCRLRDLGVLTSKHFPNIREINLENNQISDISGMEGLASLRRLNLNRNRIERLLPASVISANSNPTGNSPRSTIGGFPTKGIFACTKVEQLLLGYNHIVDMTMLGLQFLQDLKILHLQGNSIAQVCGLENSTELQDLRLDKNRIRQLDSSSVLSLRQLRLLSIEDNGLKTFVMFDSMISLEVLEASNNRVVELDEIDWLARIRSLSDLRLVNNPITKKHLYRPSVINRLTTLSILDGRDIPTEERDRAIILFTHERAAAAASASVASYSSTERVIEARGSYQSALTLAPSSVPTAISRQVPSLAGTGPFMGTTGSGSLSSDAMPGSLLRKSGVGSSPFSPGSHGQSIPSPDHQVGFKMAIAPSHTTTKSLLPSQGVALRSKNQLGGGINVIKSSVSSPAGTVTVASALSSNSAYNTYGLGRSERRRLNSVHYEQPLTGVGLLGACGLGSPIESKNPSAKPTGVLVKQGLSMHPSSAEAAVTKPPTTSKAEGSEPAPFSGYVVTFGNQKRFPGFSQQGAPLEAASVTVPYLSTKLHAHGQQTVTSSKMR